MSRRLVALVASLLIAAACSGGAHGPISSGAAAITTSAALYVRGAVALPLGQPGKLSAIAVGPEDATGMIPIVVRNNTAQTVYNVGASGTAERNGSPVTSVDTAMLSPEIVRPGEWAFGAIGFGGDSIGPVRRVELTPIADPTPAYSARTRDLKIAEAHVTHGSSSDVVAGTVVNSTDTTLTATPPPTVSVICFSGTRPDEIGLGTGHATDRLRPGATSAFSISLARGSCEGSYALSARGVTR